MYLHRALVLPLALGLALLLSACGGGGGGGGTLPPISTTCETGAGPPITVTGTVQFERLTLDEVTGLGLPLITRVARFIDVEIRISPSGTCYGRSSTDENGDYSLTVMPPANSALEVVVYSRTTEDPLRDVTVHDANPPGSNSHDPNNTFKHVTNAFPATGSPNVDVTVPYNAGTSNRPSIGFGALDVLLTCWEVARTAPSAPAMPALHVYTRLGNNFTIGTSFYSDSICSIVLLAGAAGNLDNSDTDYFDDPVVAHEFGHYVEGKLAYGVSRGGPHGSEPLEPGFAWSEGQSTGFGCLCIGSRFYTDSIGTPSPTMPIGLNVDVDVVGAAHGTGIGSEQSVQEIVYDLADGGPDGPADTDGDGIGLSRGELYEAMYSFDPASDAPYIGLFLERLVASSSLTTGQVTTLLGGTPGDPHSQGISYPLAGSDIWPVPLPIPSLGVAGVADSTPGANKNQCRGLTSSVWYRVSIPATQSVTITLSITPDGSGDDLDLFLMRNSSVFAIVASSTNGGSTTETIGPINLAAGEYLLRVEAKCGGTGNAAAYTLDIQ